MSDDLISRIEGALARWLASSPSEENSARSIAREIVDIVDGVKWTPDEIDKGARAVVEKLRLDQRAMMDRKTSSVDGMNGKIVQKPYAQMTGDEWRQFRHSPVCAMALTNISTIFKAIPRIGESAKFIQDKGSIR